VRRIHYPVENENLYIQMMMKSCLVKELEAARRTLGRVPQRKIGVGKGSTYAAVMNARIKLSMEDCVSGMGQRGHYAAAKDLQIQVTKEDFLLGMHRSRRDDAAQKGAQKRGICVRHGALDSSLLCVSKGCTNRALKEGMCERHLNEGQWGQIRNYRSLECTTAPTFLAWFVCDPSLLHTSVSWLMALAYIPSLPKA
jgi:hypothetical protein